VDESSAKSKAKRVKSWPTCISNTINKILDILMDDLPKHLPLFHNVDHKIKVVPGLAPPFKSPYQHIKKELQELKVQINNLMEWGYIIPNKSPYGSLILFVDKKDKKLHMCIDYRALNKITIKNNYFLPQIDNLFHHLNGVSHFSQIVLKSSYYQIRVEEADVEKTAMRTRYGSYEFLVMMCGLCNAPSTFTTLMNLIFHEKLDKFIIIYRNDILVYSKSTEEHVTLSKFVLQNL
jgi:hypothetical protein